MSVIWVVHTLWPVCSTVHQGVTLGFQMIYNQRFQFWTSVVTSNAYYHASKIPTIDVDEPVGIGEELFLESHHNPTKPDTLLRIQTKQRSFSNAFHTESPLFFTTLKPHFSSTLSCCTTCGQSRLSSVNQRGNFHIQVLAMCTVGAQVNLSRSWTFSYPTYAQAYYHHFLFF